MREIENYCGLTGGGHEIRLTSSKPGFTTLPAPQFFRRTMEHLQYAAGIMFWALADFMLGAIWIAVITALIQRIAKRNKHD